tara:strand:+ start:241 stop:549 length:309 start_codon:yes stop_codon:yes gene_type:complete
MKPFTSKHCAQYLSKTSPLEKSDPTKKMTQSVEPVKKKDPNKFTRNYNAATGITHEFTQDYGGNYVTPGYDFKKAERYKNNAIKEYGSLKASRENYRKKEQK